MDNPEATFGTQVTGRRQKNKIKTKNKKHNTTQKIKKMSNVDHAKNRV
jgi:hypothetical protein